MLRTRAGEELMARAADAGVKRERMSMRFYLLAALQLIAPCSRAASCIPSGDQTGINAALKGPGDEAVLCPEARFSLTGPVVFTAKGQKLYTEGRPTGKTRAALIVMKADKPQAIIGHYSDIRISHVLVDGNRRRLGAPFNAWAPELIEIGGHEPDGRGVSGQAVEWVRAYDPIGWSILHLYESGKADSPCVDASVTHNFFGPAGTHGPRWPNGNGPWADGISLACTHSRVADNRIINATDGGIVVFGAPGSTIERNEIETTSGSYSSGQQEFGGINLVDWGPYDGDYEGVKVRFNTIDAADGFMVIGIAMGQTTIGGPRERVIHGAVIENNTFKGARMGYALAIGGVSKFVVRSNVFSTKHAGAPCEGNAAFQPYVIDPGQSPSDGNEFQRGYGIGALKDAMGCNTP
jgi:hypothetical protein